MSKKLILSHKCLNYRLLLRIILFIFAFNIVSVTICFKPEKKINSDVNLNPKNVKNLSKYEKRCSVADKCRECTFEELKNIAECQVNGYKEIKHCLYSDGKKDVDEEYITKSCDENKKINPIYKCLLIISVIGAISFYVRRMNKKFMINSMLEKLSIIKDK